MATMLKHAKTGTIYPYNEELARRTDMVLIDEEGQTVSDDPVVARRPPKKGSPKPKDLDSLFEGLTNDAG